MTKPNVQLDARQRLVDAACAVFYTEGIRSVPVETILLSANVTRSTMYRYFHTKEDLALVYLAAQDTRIRTAFDAAAATAATPAALLDLVLDALSDEICADGFRGCPFMNAAIEYPNPAHPIRQAVDAHRAWFAGALERVLTAVGHPQPSTAAHGLVTLRDGAMMGGYLDETQITNSLRWAAAALLAAG
jgi:AcrR family transcriptional regulator